MGDYQKLTHKDIAVLLNIGRSKSYEILRDIKEKYGIENVLFVHFKMYFKVPLNAEK